MRLITNKGDFKIYFNCNTQSYSVYYKDRFLIGNKYKFSEVKTYVE